MADPVNVSPQDLLALIGQKEVELQLLRQEVSRLTALVPKDSEPAKK